MPTTKKRKKAGPGRLSADAMAALPDRLLDAATHVFAAEGLGGASMEKIAQKAGASTKTVYSRYSNKVEILEAVMRRLIERTLAAVESDTDLDPRAVDPKTLMVALGRRVNMTMSNDAGLTGVIIAEASRFPEMRHLWMLPVMRWQGVIRTMLEHLAKEGLAPQVGDLQTSTMLCFGLLTDRGRLRAALGQPMTPQEIDQHLDAATDLFLRGIGYPLQKDLRVPVRRKKSA